MVNASFNFCVDAVVATSTGAAFCGCGKGKIIFADVMNATVGYKMPVSHYAEGFHFLYISREVGAAFYFGVGGLDLIEG